MSAACIGVFDSGVGGLSVLRALRETLPGASFRYVADSAHAPYGERSDAFVIERSLEMAHHLQATGAELLVVACNTATATAMGALRHALPEMPIVGVEPGIKPAMAITRNARIGVMATRATLASERFAALLRAQCGASPVAVHLQACDGLAAAIEAGDFDAPEVQALVRSHCHSLSQRDVDTVVLGCTHYPFVAQHIQAAFGASVRLVDNSSAVARQTARLWKQAPLPEPELILQSTGDATALQHIARRWLGVVPGMGVEPIRPLPRSGGF